MCVTCGCSSTNGEIKYNPSNVHPPHSHGFLDNLRHGLVSFFTGQHHHHHHGSHEHFHHHHPNHSSLNSDTTEIHLEKEILHKNKLLAERNRGFFIAKNITALNMVSSPGSGKTSILEKTISDLKNELSFYVIEGDQQSNNDADRIAALNVPVIQINTGNGCHLDSDMVATAVQTLNPKENALMIIENVGNLVCPSMFDLGEKQRVVTISVTEGEDKPIKYPGMFLGSHICIINKIDLLPHLKFDLNALKNNARSINPNLQFFEVSTYTGEGMKEWYNYLRNSSTLQ